MIKIHILIDKSRIVDYTISPITFNKPALADKGYAIRYFYTLAEYLFDCDILILISKPALRIVQEPDAVIQPSGPTVALLQKARKTAGKIIWIDNSDSTTVTHFELLPYIDLYLKKFLLKDKSLYQRPFKGGRIFTDFYHKEFGIGDDVAFKQFYPLNVNEINKVHLSWNIGLGKMYKAFSTLNALRIRYPQLIPLNYNIQYTSPKANKKIDIFIRTNSKLDRKLVAFHRKELLRRLDIIIEKNKLNGSTKGKWLSNKEFYKILSNTKILPSPFGWGELGVRDYESFIYGAALLKPDMSHMETWPDIFIKNETYQPFQWDFKDLESQILDLLHNDQKRIKIATNGQEAYRNSISKKGMEFFCDWFIKQIEK